MIGDTKRSVLPNCPALEDLETPQAAPEVPEAPRAWALVAKLVQLEIYGS